MYSWRGHFYYVYLLKLKLAVKSLKCVDLSTDCMFSNYGFNADNVCFATVDSVFSLLVIVILT